MSSIGDAYALDGSPSMCGAGGAPNELLAEIIERIPLPVVFHLGQEQLFLNAEARALWPDATANPSVLPIDEDGFGRTLLEPDPHEPRRGARSQFEHTGVRRVRVPDGRQYEAATFPWTGEEESRAWVVTILQPIDKGGAGNRLLTEKLCRLKAIVHEFRNTLTSAREALSFLNEDEVGDLNEKQRRFLDSAMEDLESLGRTLLDLTSLWVTQAGVLQMTPRLVDIGRVLEQLALRTLPIVDKHRVRLHLEIGVPTPVLTADHDLLVQALRNVLINALRHTPCGGEIRIRAFVSPKAGAGGPERPGAFDTEWPRPGNEEEAVVIEIADTGPGVRDADQERIFQPFERGAAEIPSGGLLGGGGMGLGLSIARDIAVRHGGSLDIRNTGGAGSCFVFRFPKSQTHVRSWMLRATQRAIEDVRLLSLPLGCVLLRLGTGHGDQEGQTQSDLLSAVRLSATQNLRPTDAVLAIGGQLLLLIPGSTRSAASAMIDRILQYPRAMARSYSETFGESIVAFGVASYPEDGNTAEAILARAEVEASASA